MEIKINTKDLDSFQEKIKKTYSSSNNPIFYNFDMRFGQDNQIGFEDFLCEIGISKGFGERITKEKEFKAVQEFILGEFSAGFIAGFEILKEWIEKKSINDFSYCKIENSFEPKETIEELKTKKNNLNRKISALKKEIPNK